MMKTSVVSLTVWFTQILTLCALHENLLTTPELEVSTTRSENLTTNKDVRTETATMDVMTTTESADELLSDQTSPLTSMLELSGSTSSVEDDRRNSTISTSHHNIMSLNETAVSTNTTSVAMEYQETGTGPENASINIQEMTEFSTSGTSIQLDLDVQTTTTSMSWTEDRTRDTDEANTSKVPLNYSTYETDVTLTNGSDGTTDHQSPSPTTAGTYLEILSTNQTLPDDTIRPTGTSGHIKITATPVLSTQVTSGSTENAEKPLVSSMEMMDRKTEENTKALTTTQGNVYNNTTWRDGAWSTNTEDIWSTNTTMSKNVPTSEMETVQWTNCFTKGSSSQPRHFSKLVCFFTLWTLGMIASIFLGLTVFLWVRLSVTKKRAKFGEQGRKDKKGQRPTVKEKENLWAEPDSSTEERVEFWYADGATVEENKRRNRSRQVRMRSNGERQAGTEEDMWIQPTVTLKDITEFWYTKGRVRHDEETRCELNEDGV